MKRCLLLFITFLSFSCFGQTQPKASNAQAPVVQVFMDRIIKLNALAEGGYGYDILYQGKLLVSQMRNPFTNSQKGLPGKEDAFRIARWQVQQLAGGMPPNFFSGQPLPTALAKQLGINLN
jgi:hypothetical protein